MRQFTIGGLMLAIAVIALGPSIYMAGPCPGDMHCGPQCASNLRNTGLGLLQYANEKGVFPTATWPNANLPPEKRLSWYGAILPYCEAQDLWDQLDKAQPWDGDANQRIANIRIGIYRCTDGPNVPPDQPMPTPYIGIAGLGTDAPFLPAGHPRVGVFGYERRTTLLDIKDGASQTMIIAESERVHGSWLSGGPATVRGLDTSDLPYIGPGRQFGHSRQSGANVIFADGAVRFVSDTINPRVFEALSTIAGGEPLPAPEDW